jgi:hypothetical protein
MDFTVELIRWEVKENTISRWHYGKSTKLDLRNLTRLHEVFLLQICTKTHQKLREIMSNINVVLSVEFIDKHLT